MVCGSLFGFKTKDAGQFCQFALKENKMFEGINDNFCFVYSSVENKTFTYISVFLNTQEYVFVQMEEACFVMYTYDIMYILCCHK